MRPSSVNTINCLLAITSVHATSLHSMNGRSAALTANYSYSGCYTETTSERTLSSKSYYDDKMTVQKCAAACKAYDLFGLEYGRECYCGNKTRTGSVMVPNNECNFTCPGNKAQSCGGSNRLDLYYESTGELSQTTASTAPVPAPTSTKYAMKGCYTEATSGRALADKSSLTADMTVEICATTCAGFKYFGLESFRKCYCGHALRSGSVQAAAGDCYLPCAGDPTEVCGGIDRLNLYEYCTKSAPSNIPYASQGCYTEGTNLRALLAAFNSNDAMTLESCGTYCAGYTYFGVENGRECRCGNMLQAGSVKTKKEDCNYPCAGNSTQKCGAHNRLNLWKVKGSVLSPTRSTPTMMSSGTSFATPTPSIDTSSSQVAPASTTSGITSTAFLDTLPGSLSSNSAVVSSTSVSTSTTSTTSSPSSSAYSTIYTAASSYTSTASKTLASPWPRRVFMTLSGTIILTSGSLRRIINMVFIHNWRVR